MQTFIHTPQTNGGHSIETLLAAATLKLSRERPYLSHALWSVRRIASKEVPTMAVDKGWRLYYNVETVAQWSVPEIAGVLYHELCHLLRDHAGRGETGAWQTDPLGWNVAGDAEINDDLIAEGIVLPGLPVTPKSLGAKDGLTAEEYYRNHVPPPEKRPCCLCGSCATGKPEPWELSDTPGLGETEAALMKRLTAQAIRDTESRNPGTVPGHWQRFAESNLEPPKVDWRRELAAMVRRAVSETESGAMDYRYNRPSRRTHAVPNVIFPSLVRPVPKIAVVVDTSGSICGELLTDALSELRGILRTGGRKSGVSVLCVDAAVQTTKTIFDVRQVQTKGGGGTDMGIGIAAAEKLRPAPDVCIVLTDGYTPWPQTAPVGMRVIIGLLGEERSTGSAPAWAKRVVRIV